MNQEAVKKVDQYIARAPEFAGPILERIRKAFHEGCPEVQEVIKWGVPHFEYHGLLGGMAAFKQHVSFGFWKSKLMSDPQQLFGRGPKASMCNCHVESLKQLPSQTVLVAYVREAARLNQEGHKLPAKPAKKPPVHVPEDLKAALSQPKNKKANATFQKFSPSHRREYVEWITEAKRPETRKKRLDTTLVWLNEGKSRNWQYEKKKA